jgi:hypothetical protein
MGSQVLAGGAVFAGVFMILTSIACLLGRLNGITTVQDFIAADLPANALLCVTLLGLLPGAIALVYGVRKLEALSQNAQP